VRQHTGGYPVQVERAEHGQPQRQQQHPGGHAQGGADQGAAVVLGDIHPQHQQDQHQHRQPDPQGVEQVEAAAHPGDVGGLEHGEGGVHLRDPRGQAEPGGNQLLLDGLDERRQVDAHAVAGDRHRPAALAGESLDELVVRQPVGLHPGVGERLALDDPGDLGAGEALHPIGDRAGQGLELVGDLRR
jgi:hypothetical protein